MKSRFRGRFLFTMAAIVTVALSLFVAAHLIFSPGSTLTCRATFNESDGQRVTETFVHNYPGMLSYAPIGGRLVYALVMGVIIGLPTGIILCFFSATPLQKKMSVLGICLGTFLEYNLESLLVLILNSHHTEGGSFMSSETPLVAFHVNAFFPMDVLLNAEAYLLVHILKPLGALGINVLYAFPLLLGLLGAYIGRKCKRPMA